MGDAVLLIVSRCRNLKSESNSTRMPLSNRRLGESLQPQRKHWSAVALKLLLNLKLLKPQIRGLELPMVERSPWDRGCVQ